MKKIIILLFIAIGSLLVSAQATHEFSIQGGGGLSTLNYKLSEGKHSLGFGGDFGLGYTCIFKEKWGIHIGAGLGLYNAKVKLDDIEAITPNLTDSEGDCFNMHTMLINYNEAQKTMFLNIPIMIQFQTKGKQKIYAKAGGKVGIPLNCKYSVSDATLTNVAYYPDYNNWMAMPEFAGFGTFTNQKSDGELKLGIAAMLALEAGVKWKLGENLVLYTGVYFDYGLNNILKNNDQHFVNYENSYPAEFTTNSALSSFTGNVNLMAMGIKLRLALIN
ncbi:MAG: hypothetical protein FWC34_11765 [Bacteroidetes bacterium]|nr:hypothetical protein [Bacteroidota bacterium]MCL2302091.1 hypothetical protein [Lentimicrobiaceae bacterium]